MKGETVTDRPERPVRRRDSTCREYRHGRPVPLVRPPEYPMLYPARQARPRLVPQVLLNQTPIQRAPIAWR